MNSELLAGTFFDIGESGVSTTLNYTSSLITDFMPFLEIIVAVGIGLIVLAVVIKAIRGD